MCDGFYFFDCCDSFNCLIRRCFNCFDYVDFFDSSNCFYGSDCFYFFVVVVMCCCCFDCSDFFVDGVVVVVVVVCYFVVVVTRGFDGFELSAFFLVIVGLGVKR